ncbi:MAG: primosomal protein N' [Flavobacteriales bacterium]|nr:primosomal protein N' [Flavobacteriales bacterium]
MSEQTVFLDVILPLPLQNRYTYRVPRDLSDDIELGKRVVVQFGKTKVYTAIIAHIHNTAPDQYEAKYILSVLDQTPIVNTVQLELWSWMAKYYLCSQGEVMNAALPAGLKLASETEMTLNPEFNGEHSILTDNEFLVWDALRINERLTITEVMRILNLKTVMPVIKSLMDKGALLIDENLVERFKPKMETYVRLGERAEAEEDLEAVFKTLERAPKQLELLMAHVLLSDRYGERKEVRKKELLEKVNGVSGFSELVKKNVFETYEQEVSRVERFFAGNGSGETKIKFNEHQHRAIKEIKTGFENKEVTLLHGVTSSGKTEIYIQLMEEALEKGKQVLYLLPEIALTSQIINRLKVHFGGRIGVYHSKYSNNERVEIWNAVIEGEGLKYDVILGARSAVFLPFNNLGLVIVDEEHENSYKQYEPAPRYHARDTAIYLAGLHKAKTLLGTATPAMETYNNALHGKYALVEIFERYGDMVLPEIQIIDLGEAIRKKEMASHFSSALVELIGKALERKEQIILFQNRRGFSPVLECYLCGWIPECKNCDVTLTYHKASHNLRCHYCGYTLDSPKRCGACGDTNVQSKGFGTEKVEEDLAHFFPKAKIARMDLDTTRAKNAYEQIISDFEERRIDVLIGTQMVAKGLDFDHVSLVGILNADSMLGFPDFRSYERSFQLMAQVGGRAGRKNKQGTVVLQTYKPNHHVVQNVLKTDFALQFKQELEHRKQFDYPPFTRLISVTMKHKERQTLDGAASLFVNALRGRLGKRVLGPEYPSVSRVRNLYQKVALIKVEVKASIQNVKDILNEEIDNFRLNKDLRSVRIIVDVDPM